MSKKIFFGAVCALALMGASCQKAAVPAANNNQQAAQPATPATPATPAEVNQNTNTVTPAVPATPATPSENSNQSSIQTKTFNLTLTKFKFDPNILNVNAGDTVVINATAKDVTHGLSLPEFNVNLVIPQGTTQTASFVADKAGTYTFRCSVYCGAGHTDMTGTLIVK